jgi:hypothetical protein
MNTKFWTNWNFWLTLAIAVATMVNVLVSKYQWNTANTQLALNEKAFYATSRPFVGLTSQVDITKQPNYFKSVFYIRNFGTTPAKIIKTDWIARVAGEPTSGYIGSNQQTMILFPGDQFGVGFEAKDRQAENISVGTTPLAVSLDIEYYGVSDQTYKTHQEHKYDHQLNNFFTVSGKWQ